MRLTGKVSDSITCGQTVVRLGNGAGSPNAGFFVETLDAGGKLAEVTLLLVRDRPFALSVESSGRRGFQAQLEVRGRARAGASKQAVIVQSTDNFDPNGLDSKGSVLLDHWSDSNRALSAVSREEVVRDGADIAPDDRHVITLKVVPVIKAIAAGLRWTDLGPFCSRAEYEELAALMAAYAPRECLENVPKDGIGKLIKHLRELKTTEGIFDVDTQFKSEGIAGRVSAQELDDTDALFDVPADFSKPAPARTAAPPAPPPAADPPPSQPGPVAAALTKAGALQAYLAHGAAISVGPSVPLTPAEAGAQLAVEMSLMIVDSPEVLKRAREMIRPA